MNPLDPRKPQGAKPPDPTLRDLLAPLFRHKVLWGKNVEEDAQMQPGDMIFVPEKFITNFRKYVPYNIGTGLYLSPLTN